MKKKLTITLLFTTILILLTTTGVYAYQSIGTENVAGANITAAAWLTGIRQMESEGQGMGLTETVDTTTGLATSESNDIDVHMMKNTEYGAIVILGASEYGKQGEGIERYMTNGAKTLTGTDVKATTTGNVYGIYEMGYTIMNARTSSFEFVAGAGNAFAPAIAAKYINRYTTDEISALVGDATVETRGWRSGIGSWLSNGAYVFNRSVEEYDSSFSYRSSSYSGLNSNFTNCARATVVSGDGF